MLEISVTGQSNLSQPAAEIETIYGKHQELLWPVFRAGRLDSARRNLGAAL
jgi:hypothetical protein